MINRGLAGQRHRQRQSRGAVSVLLADPPSLDKGEVTDKGSINQRAVLTHRAATVAALHGDSLPNI